MQLEPFRRPARLARLAWRASRAYGTSPRAVWQRARLLRRGYGFRMHDAVPLGLLDPSVPESRFGEFVPFGHLNALERRLSPPALTAVIDDKVLFWLVCLASGLPTPRLRAIVRRSRSGWADNGTTPRSREEWARALATLADGEFVAKPARGDRGEGVRAFELRRGRFSEGRREIGDGGALCAALLADRRYRAFVLQDRLRNHETIARLSGAKTLQTLRVWTLLETTNVTSPEDVTVLGGALKFVSGEAAADNLSTGADAGGFSLIDLETGSLGALVRTRRDGFGQEQLDRHPRTGAVYRGMRVPLWDEALRLARRAAVAFPMLRTLGWDIAVTPDGPVLLEANAGWGSLGIAPRWVARLEDALGGDADGTDAAPGASRTAAVGGDRGTSV